MTQSPTGGPAATVYQVSSRQGVVGRDAQRVVIVTDGRAAEGGPQQAAYLVTDAEIAAGDFIVTGNKPLPIVLVGQAGAEHPPVAYYDVTGKPDDVQPSQSTDPVGDVLRASTTAYYKLESDGSDGSGNGYNLTNDGVTFAAAKIGNGAAYDGSAIKLSTTRGDGLQLGILPLTISFWIKLTDYPTLNANLVGRGSNAGDEYGILSPYLPVADHYYGFNFFIADGAYTAVYSPPAFSVTPPYSLNEWHFVVAWFDPSGARTIYLQVDNGTIYSQDGVGDVTPVDTDFSIGDVQYDGYTTKGIVDEVRISRELTTQEQRDYLYNSGAGRTLYP